MRSGPAFEFKRTDGHEYWRYFLLEQRGEESCGHRGVVDVAPRTIGGRYDGIVGGFFVPGAQIFNESYPGREDEWPVYATSPMVPSRLDFETLVAEDYNDVDSVYWHGVMGSVENEWYGTTAGSIVDVLIVQSNYPEGKEGVPVIVPARGAKWAFSEIYGRLAALQAAGAGPIIEAWLAGELPLTSFP